MKTEANCVSFLLNRCDGIGCEKCPYYETYEDWDACDNLIMAMRDMS